MPLVNSLRVFLQACRQWSANQDSRLGAALAYYALFSIAPLLIITIQIAGLVFGEDAARGKVVEQLKSMIGTEEAHTLQALVIQAAQPQAAGWSALVSFSVLVIGALTIFLQMRYAFCTIWKLEPPQGNTWLGLLVDYLLALLMVVTTGILLLVSLAASMAIPILRDFLDEQLPGNGRHWQLLELAASVLTLTILFAAIFYVLSGRRLGLGHVLYGSLITAILFSVGKIALGMYLVYSSTASMYGAAGSLVVFLVWVYYSSQILYFGAELIQARRTRREWMGKIVQ
jgi:membrane protein